MLLSPRLSLILLLAVLFCLSLTAATAVSAADGKEQTVFMEEIVVTATREEIPAAAAAATITVLDREDLALLPATTVAEALQFIPGVQVSFEGNGPGAYAVARIQGSEVRHVAVYADGVPLNLQASPLTHLSYLPLAAIERVEVYKGPASSAWGSSLGGVINIVTRAPETQNPFSGEIRTSRGEAGTRKSRGHVQGRGQNGGYFLALTDERSDGFEDHSRYRQQDGYARFQYDLHETGRLSLTCSYNDGHIQDPIIGYLDFWDDMTHERTWQMLRYTGWPADNVQFTLEGWHRRFEGLIEDVYSDQRVVFSDYEEEVQGGAVRLTWRPDHRHRVTAGLDGEWGDYEWQNYIDTNDTGNWALYVNDTWSRGAWSLNAGLRYDKNREFAAEISPSLGVVYRCPGWPARVRAQVARGFSAPPGSWINDPYGGNPDLDPETAWNTQLGAEVELLPFLRLGLTGFYAEVNDLIRFDWDRLHYVNISETTRRGLEGGLYAAFANGLRLSVSGCYTDVENEDTGRTVKDIPRLQYQAAAVYAARGLTQSLHGTWVDHNSSFPETADEAFIFDYRAEADLAVIFDHFKGSSSSRHCEGTQVPEAIPAARAPDQRPRGVKQPPTLLQKTRPRLFITVYNLFNSRYLYREVWPQPGRWVEGGVVFNF